MQPLRALLVLFIAKTCTAVVPLRTSDANVRSTCEPIRTNHCRNLGYNTTRMPNLAGNELQHEAEFYLKTFLPLIQYGCSAQLQLFLCSVYVPMCTEKVANPIGPCRGLCESVRSKCYPVLQGFGFEWPDALNCSHFPVENNHVHMCMEGPPDAQINVVKIDISMESFECPPNHVKVDGTEDCVALCDSGLIFDSAEKKFAEAWVTVWALICLVASVGATLTICIGGGRSRAPPLTCISFCYCLISIGWMIRMMKGRANVSCQTAEGVIAEDGLSNANCAVVFLILYYFGMASIVWWVSLCIWWMAKAGLGWSPEKLRGLSSFLHVASWGLPAAQTVACLVRRDVDADELTGTCYVGNKNNATLTFLVLIPQAIYLSIGVLVLIIGTLCILRKPQPPVSAAPLTAAAPRKDSDIIGALATIYIVPIACVLASIIYERNNRDSWLSGREHPAVWAFLLRHLMSLLIGVSTVFWMWSKKSVTAWKSVLRRVGPRKPLQVKCQTLPLRYVPTAAHSHVPSTLSTTLSTAGSRHSTRHPHRKPRIVHHHRPASENII